MGPQSLTRAGAGSRIPTAARAVRAVLGVLGVCLVAACGASPVTATSAPAATPAAATPAPAATLPPAATPSPQPSSTPAQAPADGTFGDPVAAARYWQPQSFEDNCGLVSVADVVGEITGHALTEREIVTLAETTPSGTNPGPIYAPPADPGHTSGDGGIEMADEVVLLEHYGIRSVMTDWTQPDQTGLPALKRYLAAGRKVIAWVNSAVIWDSSDQRAKADHFLVVTGVDTIREVVHLNDPGADHADEQVTIASFLTAWHAGEDSIVVTTPAA